MAKDSVDVNQTFGSPGETRRLPGATAIVRASDDQDRRNFEQSMDDDRRMNEETRNEDPNLSPGH